MSSELPQDLIERGYKLIVRAPDRILDWMEQKKGGGAAIAG